MTTSTKERARVAARQQRKSQQPVISQRPYLRLWHIYRSFIIIGGGLVTAVLFAYLYYQPVSLFDYRIAFTLFGLLIAFIVGDLFSLSLRNIHISLSFPVTLLAHLLAVNDEITPIQTGAFIVVLGVVLGAVASETLRRYRNNATWSHRRIAARIAFYAAHHALAAFGAAATFLLVVETFDPFFVESIFHLQAIIVYLLVYPVVSMLILWPHDWLVTYLLVPLDETRFASVNLLSTILIAPAPLIVFYLSASQGEFGAMIIFLLFLAFLFIIRSYTNIEGREKQLQEQERLRQEIGTPPNMAELMRRLSYILDRMADYRWGAFYSASAATTAFRLRAKFETERHPKDYKPTAAVDGTHVPAPVSVNVSDINVEDEQMDLNVVHWPVQIENESAGYLGQVYQSGTAVSGMELNGHHRLRRSDLFLPPKTSFLFLPVTYEGEIIGILALTRSGRTLFGEKDKSALDNVVATIGTMLRNVQQVEAELQRLLGKLERFTGNPELVQQTVQSLTEQGVDVGKILNGISKHSFRSNLRNVLHSVVAGENNASQELDLSEEDLTTIYEQVRDTSPDMPPLTPEIMQHLRMLPSSLNLAFSFRYAWPEFSRGEQFVELYRFFNHALEAKTIPQIIALQPGIDKAIHDLSGQGTADPAILTQLNRLITLFIPLRKTTLEDVSSEEKSSFLNQSLDKLGELEQSVRGQLTDPERFIFLNVIAQWQATITRTLDKHEQEGAKLEITLRQNHALSLANEPITISALLHNSGSGAATRVEVTCEQTADYEVLDEMEHRVGVVSPNSSKELLYRIRPRQQQDRLRLKFQLAYRDRERTNHRQSFADVLYLRAEPPPFQPIPNPYIAGPALHTGSNVFVGREDVFAYIRQNIVASAQQQRVLLLISERRMGKTSVLKQLPVKLNDQDYVHVFLDCQGIGIDPGTPSFFLSVAEAIAEGLENIGVSVPLPAYTDLEQNARHTFEKVFLADVWQKIGDRRLLVAIDEYEVLEERVQTGKIDRDIILYLRSLIQHTPQMAFIFAGTHALEELTADYWHVLFNIAKYKRIGFLDEASARQLMLDPVAEYGMVYDDLAVDEMLQGTGGHPFFLQAACDHLVGLCNREERNFVTIRHVRHALDAIIDEGRPHLNYLWDHSDDVEQAVIAGLGKTLMRYSKPSLDRIMRTMTQVGYSYKRQEVRRALRQLEDRFIVQRRTGANQVAYYDFVARLYHMWVQRYHTLD